MKQTLLFLLIPILLTAQPKPEHNLTFKEAPTRWEDAFPIGNAILGGLVYQKGNNIRISLDRADLWDTRPMQGLDRPEFTYRWVAEQVEKGEYGIVQDYFDKPYEENPAPTKLPGAAIEFEFLNINESESFSIEKSELDLKTGLVTIFFTNKVTLKVFIHAKKTEGWYAIDTPKDARFTWGIKVNLVAPSYGNMEDKEKSNSTNGDNLARLGYRQNEVIYKKLTRGVEQKIYQQPCSKGFSYQVTVINSSKNKHSLEGVWSISSHFPDAMWADKAEKTTKKAIKRGFNLSFEDSKKWWEDFWAKSAIRIPDTLLEKQYYLDQYKFGCLARSKAPMISLQGIWTADNGKLPPWKGDLHHDLNTEMSYWSAYTSGHSDLAEGYLRHIKSNDAAHRDFTKKYFGTSGLNIPGVETLLGQPMGGWIQYACSPTTSAWIAQHFYLHWRYTQDMEFLKKDAYPFFHDVAVHLDELTQQIIGKRKATDFGFRVLPLSSTPEINNNDISAWFPNQWTNYDLALARFVFEKSAEMATILGKKEDAAHWKDVLVLLPTLDLTPQKELTFATNTPYLESHRHFSHLMAIHPLGLLDWNKDSVSKEIIQNSLKSLSKQGTKQWTGYSFAWQANLLARAHDGVGACKALQTFASAFVSKNSFHLNGDQSREGYSSMRYDPFTLEGNFASAAGIQEMLLQSHGNSIEVFPSIPDAWQDVSYANLCAEGGYKISATRLQGINKKIEIIASQLGSFEIRLPKGEWVLETNKGVKKAEMIGKNNWKIKTKKGKVVFNNIQKSIK
jgi:alpha-L-fucosidase 2